MANLRRDSLPDRALADVRRNAVGGDVEVRVRERIAGDVVDGPDNAMSVR